MTKTRQKLGEILAREGLLGEADLKRALEAQKKEGGKLGEILVKMGMVDEENIAKALSSQLNIPFASGTAALKPAVNQGLDKVIPQEIARSYQVLPLAKTKDTLKIAVVDPLDLIGLDNLRKMVKLKIERAITTKTDLERAMNEFYGEEDLLKEAVSESYRLEKVEDTKSAEEAGEVSLEELMAKVEEAPVIKLVNLIILRAIKDRASDIHIEQFEERLNIRYRIDGVLYEIQSPSYLMALPIISRIKILANLDIAEKRLPQDGGFAIKLDNRVIDLRVSTIPAIYGEKVVIRILDKTAISLDVEKLGFEPDEIMRYRNSIRRPYGLVLLTGPTGCGKTTTLYASLTEIKSPAKNIITIEEPVEYRLDGINQVQTKPHIGLSFANALRSFLRQDPDIMMVGEIRDLETAQICVRAALTGHLILSTLHTNDAPGAIDRLLDIGIEPFLLVSSLTLVAAQRLVRVLCPECKRPSVIPEHIRQQYNLGDVKVFKPTGCEFCRHTGFAGRTAIFEVMPIQDELKKLIYKKADIQTIRDTAKKLGMKTLLESGMAKVKKGITNIDEVMAVAFEA